MTDYCERDLVKRMLEITVDVTTYDDKIDNCIEEAGAVLDNALARFGGVPQPVPEILQYACANLATATFKRPLDPTGPQPFYDLGMLRIKEYVDSQKRGTIPFKVGEATS